jgi:hypothetical protein
VVVPEDMHIIEHETIVMETDPAPADSSENSKRGIFSIGDSYVNTFYVGSITVVGLFILFRMMQKSK